MGQQIELLLELPLDVDLAGSAEEVEQPGPANVAVDDFGSDAKIAHQPGERPRRVPEAILLFDDELFERLKLPRPGGLRTDDDVLFHFLFYNACRGE